MTQGTFDITNSPSDSWGFARPGGNSLPLSLTLLSSHRTLMSSKSSLSPLEAERVPFPRLERLFAAPRYAVPSTPDRSAKERPSVT